MLGSPPMNFHEWPFGRGVPQPDPLANVQSPCLFATQPNWDDPPSGFQTFRSGKWLGGL